MESSVVSIIVPIYKVEAYLPACVESILAQSYQNFELILVDDGSPDGCPALCDAYAAQDSRVRVIHQKNGGVSAARNAGLDAARGEFFTFVDADDALEPEGLALLLEAAEKTGSDLIGGVGDDCAPHTLCREAALQKLLLLDEGLGGSACGRLYRRSSLGDLRFDPQLAVAEDRLFFFAALCRCPEYQRCGGAVYRVKGQPNSATRGAFSAKQFGIVASAERVRSMVRRILPQLTDYADYHVTFAKLDLINAMLRSGCGRRAYPEDWARITSDLRAADLRRWTFAGKRSLSRLRLFRWSPWAYGMVYRLYRQLKKQ